MFQKGDYIVYRSTGVCRVDDIGARENFLTDGAEQLYYHLVPIHGTGTIYIPVDSSVFMRPVISKEQAQQLIASIPSIEEHPNYSKNQKVLIEEYRSLLQTHDCTALVQLILDVHKKELVLNAQGKTAGKTDLQYMKQAQTLLHEELSVALDIPYEDVADYIRQQIKLA
ncbi:MAG: CarD family transcriptional regulator [Peptococcaceae bacterium]